MQRVLNLANWIGAATCNNKIIKINNSDLQFNIIFLYVYYIIIIGSFTNSIGQIKNSLHSEFAMTDLGLLRQFLGLEIEQNGKGIMMSQPQYASDLMKKFNMD